jgi:hypothetical protein
MIIAARSTVASSTSGEGDRSSRPTTSTGERSTGSDSMRQSTLSDADGRSGNRSSSVATSAS